MKHRLRKKLVTLLTTIAVLISASVPAMAAVADTGFTDVAADAWYAEAVEYVKDNGLMSGTSDTAFEPDAPATRAMLVTSLYHSAGRPEARPEAFSDVADGAWYGDAAGWASGEGIVSGYGDGRFGPDDPVTREQLAAILWQAEGRPAAGSSGTFSDQASISAYAAGAAAWARENGIISGKENNRFDPAGLATRAETATILYHYLNAGNESNTPDVPDTPVSSETAITITVGDTVIPAVLNSSVSARDLISRLPLTVSMTRGSVDYYSTLSDPLDFAEADVHNGWRNGDIGFDGTYLTMFHGGEDASADSGNQITLGRVSDLTLLNGLAASVQATFALTGPADDTPKDPAEGRTLIVYYSHSQRTENVAELLREKTGGDIYELVPAEPYTGSDNTIAARATQEIESGNLPAFSGTLPDLSRYDTILIGGPVWSYTVSAPILSYLEQAGLSGKTVAPFWTDQGGPGDYREAFTDAAGDAANITEFLQLSNTTFISQADMSARLDAWLEGVFE